MSTSDNPKNVKRKAIVLAAKDISQNRRVPLIARSLSSSGFDVEVLALTTVHDDYHRPDIKWTIVPAIPLVDRILNWLERIEANDKNENLWRRRFGVGFVGSGIVVGIIETVYRIVRIPFVRLIAALFGQSMSTKQKQEVIRDRRASIFLRSRFGSYIDELRREKFHAVVKSNLSENTDHIDLVVCHDRFSAPCVETLLRKDAGIRVIFDAVELIGERSTVKLERQNRRQDNERRAAKNLMTNAHAVLTIGDGLKQFFESEYGVQNVDTIYNGREMRDWSGVASKSRKNNKITLGFSGSFFEGCGLSNLIKTIQKLPSNYELLLAGRFSSSAYEIDILTRIESLQLADRIHLVRNPSVDKIPEILTRADLYVIPFETGKRNVRLSMPNRVFDALASNLVIVGNEGLFLTQWIIEKGIGAKVQFSSPSEAALGLQQLNSQNFVGKNRPHVKAVFEETCWARQEVEFQKLIKQMIPGT